MTTLISILFCTLLSAPPNNSGVVFESEGINYYEPLIKAVVMVESSNGKHTYNPDEGAVGWFQIRQVRVDDYNKERGMDHKLADFYDYDLSREMFLYYCKGRSFESVAKSWNGSGPMVIDYWNRVKSYL